MDKPSSSAPMELPCLALGGRTGWEGKGAAHRGCWGCAGERKRTGEKVAMDEPKSQPRAGSSERAGAAGASGAFCTLWFITDVDFLS